MGVSRFVSLAKRRPHRILPYFLRSAHPYVYPVLEEMGNTSVKRTVQGSVMELDLHDRGLNVDLLANGYREPRTTKLYQKLLGELHTRLEKVTVFDIGANVGYYALMACNILGDKGQILAVEPDPRNVKNLQRNIDYNDYSNIDVDKIAISNRDGTGWLYRASHSNHHTLDNTPKEFTGHRIEVNVRTPTTYLQKKGVQPSEIDVVRMDVQGQEYKILPELSDMYKTSSPLLLQVEIHPVYLNDGEIETVISTLESHGFDFLTGIKHSKEVATCYSQVPENNWVEVFVTKNW